jgi:hypothetical protein
MFFQNVTRFLANSRMINQGLVGVWFSTHLNINIANRCKCDKNRLVTTATITTFATFRTFLAIQYTLSVGSIGNKNPVWQLLLLPHCSLKPNANLAQLAQKSAFDRADNDDYDDISDS